MTTDRNWFLFQARLARVVDGDTLDIVADLGFRVQTKVRVRLMGVDTAEIYGVSQDSDEYELGMEHADWVHDWFLDHGHTAGADWPFVLETEKDTGKYGRWPAEIYAKDDGSALVEDLVTAYPEVAD